VPIVYLLIALAGLPIVLIGQRADRTGRSGAVLGGPAVRAAGAALLFGGLTGFALSLLALHPVAAAAGAVGLGGAAGYLRARIIQLHGGAVAPPATPEEAGGITAVVVAEVSDAAQGKVVVEMAGERWYLAAEPFARGSFREGTLVVIAGMRDDVALVARPEDVRR